VLFAKLNMTKTVILSLLAADWFGGNFYSLFIELFYIDIMFLILFFTVCRYMSCLSVVILHTYIHTTHALSPKG
jgi:hypothetical protein